MILVPTTGLLGDVDFWNENAAADGADRSEARSTARLDRWMPFIVDDFMNVDGTDFNSAIYK